METIVKIEEGLIEVTFLGRGIPIKMAGLIQKVCIT
jgi:hypothetical protein